MNRELMLSILRGWKKILDSDLSGCIHLGHEGVSAILEFLEANIPTVCKCGGTEYRCCSCGEYTK